MIVYELKKDWETPLTKYYKGYRNSVDTWSKILGIHPLDFYGKIEAGLFNAWFKHVVFQDENTEGVSGADSEPCVLHGVSDRNASRSDSTKVSKEVVGGTLALRTEPEKMCSHTFAQVTIHSDDGTRFLESRCSKCGVWERNLKGS